jgi:hypothetical protein
MEITLVTLFVVVLVGEAILNWTWSPLYFRFGIPLLRHEAKVFATGGEMPRAEDLAERLHESRYPPLDFRAFGAGTYAFREHTGRAAIGRFGYTPVMHGRLELDREHAVARVVGLANWTPGLFAGAVVLFFVAFSHPWWIGLIFAGLLAGLCGWIYSIQRRRYREAATVAAQLWSGDLIQPS